MNKYQKKKKLNKRKIIFLAMIQLAIILFGLFAILINVPIAPEKIESKAITVEDTIFNRVGPNLIIYSGTDKYVFGNNGKYTASQLEEMISVGDRISISCAPSWSVLFGKHYQIVEASTDTCELCSLEKTNEDARKAVVAGIIVFGIVELVFVFVVVSMMISKSFYRN